ncbi:MAG: hypothetical protein IPH53_01810 [Flavobacteriales bacterium]|nr:hypothetical protein [Flavobacteriales bacterium]
MRYFAAFVLALGLMPLSGKAQYVINDPEFLVQLQDAVPNAISGNVLDTLHPDVISPYRAGCQRELQHRWHPLLREPGGTGPELRL